VEGNSNIGFLESEDWLNLIGQGESTEVTYEGEVQVGGKSASGGWTQLPEWSSRNSLKNSPKPQ
jgi:carbon monoxide dehydrogenase subunit G